jgi:DNA-binding NarL/FixJ family response regulator
VASIDLAASKRSARAGERESGAKVVRLLIASGQPLFLDGLEALLGNEADVAVIARCSDDESIVRLSQEKQPDVALLDIDISRENSLRTVRRLNDAAPAMKVVLFTARAEGDALIEAVRLGVRGVLLKSGASSVIAQCLRQVQAGAYWLEKQMTAAALGRMVRREATQRQLSRAGLTPRELEIARLAGQGLRNAGIGAKLGISPATVKIHLHQIYRKLSLSGRIALMVYARDNDLL